MALVAVSKCNSSNCILEFPQTHINARFLSHIDNFGSPPSAMIHLVLNENSRAITDPAFGAWQVKANHAFVAHFISFA